MALDMTAFRKSLRYVSNSPSSTVLADLNAIARLDRHAQQQKRKFGTRGVTCFVGIIACFFLAIITSGFGSTIFPVLFFLLGAIAFGGSIACAVAYSHWSRIDVPDVRHQLPTQLMDMLGRDMAAGSAMNLEIDFSFPTQPHKKIHTGPHPYRARWKRDYFEDGWLNLQGEFLDGTTYTLKTNEMWIRSHGWKRSRSGKNKHKSKTKAKALELELVLHFSRKRYGAVAALEQDIANAVKLPVGAQLKKVKVDDNKMGLRVKIDPAGRSGFNPQLVYGTTTSMFLSLYHVLTLAQKLSKSR